MNLVWKIGRAVVLGATLLGAGSAAIADELKEIKLDFANYSPQSLVIRKFGWLEDEFKPDGVTVKWVFSQGSNRSLEYLNSGASYFASTSNISALVSRANGSPLKSVYTFSRTECTALLGSKTSTATGIADLKGKKIAATKGTDPFFFLLRALHANNLTKDDVQIVHLQHPEGRTALVRGEVDAWASLDPIFAAAEIEDGARTIYRNEKFGCFGVINVPEKFAQDHPEAVKRVLKVYEKARQWIISNPDETRVILSAETKLPEAVIARQLSRYNFGNPVINADVLASLNSIAPILVDEAIVRKGSNLAKVTSELVDNSFIDAVKVPGGRAEIAPAR
jgi:sulfonate transport system substrate-binding protein